MESGKLAKCVGCGGFFPAIAGPTHRYMESSPGCWATYGEVLAREYSDPRYAKSYRFGVDAYAVQHPGRMSPQSIQSVAVHLIRLLMLLEQETAIEHANDIMLRATSLKDQFVWLTPPQSRGAITVADVARASSPKEHLKLEQNWAEAAWQAWTPHHATVRDWVRQLTD